MLDRIVAVAATVVALLSLIAQFYIKWVPDVKDQRRHLKRAGIWLWNVTVFALQGFDFYLFSRDKGPITAGFVLTVALFTVLTVLYATVLAFNYLVLNLIVGGERGLGILGVIEGMLRALETLSSDPNLSDETVQNLRGILYGGDRPHHLSKRLSDPIPAEPGAPSPDFRTKKSTNPAAKSG